MSGLGRKVFQVLEQLGAAEVNGYLMDQSVMVFADSAARTAAIPTPSAGMVTYRIDANVIEFHNGSAWVNLVSSNELDQLSDVDLTSVQNLDSLIWNGSEWINQRLNLDDLGNVNISTPGAGEYLKYDDLANEWVNDTISIDNLSDVNAPTPLDKNSLVYDDASNQWIPYQLGISDLVDTIVSTPGDGDLLVYNSTGGNWENDDTTYQKTSEKDQANGYAGLNAMGQIDAAQIPSLAISHTFVVANQAARLALTTAEIGDIAVQTDTSETYILEGSDPTNNADWVQLLFPPDIIDSVNGQTGTVVLGLGDIDDVTISMPADGEILTYDDATNEWINGPAPSGTLAGLTDVDVTGVVDGETIVYDSATSTWIPGESGGGGFEVSATPPPFPTQGDTWFDSDTGVAYIWYDDGTSAQWVQLGGGGGGGGGASVTVDETAPSSPSLGDLWFDSSDGRTYVYYEDINSSQWIEIGNAFTNNTDPIRLNGQTISEDYTIPVGYNGLSAGPVTIASGVTVTIPSGSAWSIV